MSVKAIQWALIEAPVDDPTEALVLVALADRCSGEDGQGAWPSHAWLAKRCRVSERSVRRLLVKLEKDGLIRRGDQRMVAHVPADRRPIVWDLILTTGHPRPVVHDRPVTHDRSSMTARSPTTGRGCPTNQVLKELTTKNTSSPATPVGFDEFWAAYPRKVGKGTALKAWARAVKDAGSAEPIMAGLSRYRFSDDPKYRPHPSTWLNDRRWEDEDATGSEALTEDERYRDEQDYLAQRGKYKSKPWEPPKDAYWSDEHDGWLSPDGTCIGEDGILRQVQL